VTEVIYWIIMKKKFSVFGLLVIDNI